MQGSPSFLHLLHDMLPRGLQLWAMGTAVWRNRHFQSKPPNKEPEIKHGGKQHNADHQLTQLVRGVEVSPIAWDYNP